MDEYVIDVVINGAPDKLKTYCSSIYSAIDSMLGIEMVEEILSVRRTIDNKIWDIKDMDVAHLRQLKENMDDNLLADAFKSVEDLYIDTIH
tara:strand:- start:1702 stop:1974 length:273 start_codon:yes stop_codon:yes gene_type:complete